MSEEQIMRRTWHGYPSWTEYLKANMALMPLVAICGAVALQLADARYMVRDVDGESVEQQIETVQTAVTDIQAKQQVFTSEIEHIKASVQDVKEDTAEINRKLDRLIERQR